MDGGQSMAIFDKLDDEKKIQVVASSFEEGCQSADTIFDKLDDANKLKVRASRRRAACPVALSGNRALAP